MAIEKKEVFLCKASDLEKIIDDNFNFREDYSIVAAEECCNYVCRTFHVTPIEKNSHGARYVGEMIALGDWRNFRTNILLDSLCATGLLEAGTYIVDVSW